jgi:hypothetical protein
MLDDGTSASTAHKLRLLFIFLNVNAQKQIDAHAVCAVRIGAAVAEGYSCAEGLQPVPSLLRTAVAAVPCQHRSIGLFTAARLPNGRTTALVA